MRTTYPMIQFYCASRKKRVTDATNRQCEDRLNTVFNELTSQHGVTMTDTAIGNLSGHTLQMWFNAFVDARKPSTINNYLSFLNPFLRWAHNIGYITTDLSPLLKFVKVPTADSLPEWEQPKDKYLTHADVEKLLKTAGTGVNAKRNRCIIALLLYSGLRVSELCSLTMQSIMDRPLGTLYCKRKGGRWANVFVSTQWYPYLDEYLEGRTDTHDPNAPLFRTTRGTPLDRFTVYAAIKPIQKALGQATGPHVLRHTYISEMEKIGGLTIARDLANHKSFNITNRYDHTTDQQKSDAVESLRW